MYREGPQGTPFHTLLAEGYVDGPIDVCKFINVRGITILFLCGIGDSASTSLRLHLSEPLNES